jgi:hypothetical protein
MLLGFWDKINLKNNIIVLIYYLMMNSTNNTRRVPYWNILKQLIKKIISAENTPVYRNVVLREIIIHKKWKTFGWY